MESVLTAPDGMELTTGNRHALPHLLVFLVFGVGIGHEHIVGIVAAH